MQKTHKFANYAHIQVSIHKSAFELPATPLIILISMGCLQMYIIVTKVVFYIFIATLRVTNRFNLTQFMLTVNGISGLETLPCCTIFPWKNKHILCV